MSVNDLNKLKQGLRKPVLGRGLSSLLANDVSVAKEGIGNGELLKTSEIEVKSVDGKTQRVWNLSIEKIEPGNQQPRKHFDKSKIEELANSIKKQGVLQPLIVRKKENGNFELVAGERRWRAAQQAGLHEIPAIIKEANDQTVLEWALIENIQREDLNPIEEAMAYDELIKNYQLSQQEVADRVGKDRATIANTVRLLRLPMDIQNAIKSGEISTGHAKALLSISDENEQNKLVNEIIRKKWSVRELEKNLKRISNEYSSNTQIDVDVSKRLLDTLRSDLQKNLGSKIDIYYKEGKGKMSIYFHSDEEFNNIIERLKL